MVFEHLRDPARQLCEMGRVLKPGGLLVFHTPNRWGYSTVMARCLPEKVKAPLIDFLQGRGEEDVFPTYYRINSRAEIERLANEAGLQIRAVRMVASHPDLIMIPPLAVLELLWIRLTLTKLLGALRSDIIAILKKP